jgi:pantoate--beta-alanine ligase
MKIIKKIKECKAVVKGLREKGYLIGFIPTMGALHPGHLSLIRMARKDCDKVFISIFVNPAQFGPQEDYKKYPRNIKRDRMLAGREGVDYIFFPAVQEIYGSDHKTFVAVEELDRILCGKYRPGHFKGVATVVIKMFNIINAHRAYFGQKDYQQTVIIKKMVKDLNMDIEIINGPTIRESDGLAMSSRNKYLTFEERANAVVLYQSLNIAKDMIRRGEKDLEKIKREAVKKLKSNRFVKSVDYFEFRDPVTLDEMREVEKKHRNLLAVSAIRIGKTRLIDNMVIKV